jgi:hypothetical protein
MTKPTIPEVLPRFVAYHANNGAWGSLHIVLDDNNVADAHVRYCSEWAREQGDVEGEALAEILLRMSKTQRGKLPTSVYWAERAPVGPVDTSSDIS